MMRRHWSIHMLVLSTVILLAGCNSDAFTDAEQTAIQFYKAVWVQGNLERAKALLQDQQKVKDLEWRVKETRQIRPSNSAIFIAESPLDPHISSRVKTYLIHRDADKKDYAVEVRKIGGQWRVTSFKQGYSPKQRGENNFEVYERLNSEHPHTEWKKIDNP